MKQVTINTYKFNELSAEVQKSLIEKNRHILVQYDDWCFPILEGFIEDMREMGHNIKLANIQFTGFWSQGDGLSFTTGWDELNVESIFRVLEIDLPADEYRIRLCRSTSHYLHEKTVWLDVDSEGRDLDTDEVARIEEYLRGLMNRVYRDLEKYWYESTSDEAVAAELNDLELDYTESGKTF
jgi:hypothetical protein